MSRLIIGDLAQTPNITSIDDTGIEDGEIAVFNLTDKKIETSNVLIGDVTRNLVLLLDTTIDNAWNTNALSVDDSTNVFTLVAHGFSVGDPVEFDANTGVLPIGVSAYNANIGGGFYYNIATVPSADTFTITDTVGSVTPLDITSTGTAGYRVRAASLSNTGTIVGFDSTLYSELKFIVIYNGVKLTTGAWAGGYVTFNSGGGSVTFRSSWNGVTGLFAPTPTSSTSKYIYINEQWDMKKIGNNWYATGNSLGVSSANSTTFGANGYTGGANILSATLPITAVRMVSNNGAVSRFRSGFNIKIYGRI